MGTSVRTLSEIRVRSRMTDAWMRDLRGKVLTDQDYDLLITGPTRLTGPRGEHICTYLPGILSPSPDHREILRSIKVATHNRTTAAGAGAWKRKKITRGGRIHSATVGFMDPMVKGNLRNTGECRLTAWTGKHASEFEALFPLLRQVGRHAEVFWPEAYERQMREVERTPEDFVIPGTPFTTLTVNNSYATGVHKDSGDLDRGVSCLAFFRYGDYGGGHLVFPQFRVALAHADNSLALMDAHQWHGNTKLELSEGAERVSLVCYFRTGMVNCPEAVDGSP